MSDLPTPARALMEAICLNVADRHRISLCEIRGSSRRAELVAARHEAMWRMKRELRLSSTQIGRYFNRDHTSVLHAVWKLESPP